MEIFIDSLNTDVSFLIYMSVTLSSSFLFKLSSVNALEGTTEKCVT